MTGSGKGEVIEGAAAAARGSESGARQQILYFLGATCLPLSCPVWNFPPGRNPREAAHFPGSSS